MERLEEGIHTKYKKRKVLPFSPFFSPSLYMFLSFIFSFPPTRHNKVKVLVTIFDFKISAGPETHLLNKQYSTL